MDRIHEYYRRKINIGILRRSIFEKPQCNRNRSHAIKWWGRSCKFIECTQFDLGLKRNERIKE